MKLKKLFARLQNIETGGEAGSTGGSAVDTSAAAGAGDAGAASAISGASDAPKSMLEAIEQGLKTNDDAGQQKQAGDRTRDEQGRFAKTQEGDKPAADAAQTDAAKAAAAKQAEQQQQPKPGDDLAMPEGLSEKARERFHALTNRLHETTARATALEQDLNGFREVMRGTGGRPEDFAQAFDYITAMNRGDFQTALTMLDAQRAQLAVMMGRPLPGVDALSEFPDLKQRVEAYQMDERAALEIARARKAQAAQAQQYQQVQAQQQQTQRTQTERRSAMAEVDRMGAEWAKRDPDFAMKEEIILKQIPIIAERFPPQLWPQQVRILYDTLSAMPAPQPQRQPAPAPLRPSGQTAGARVPSSMLDAISSGLGYANG